LFRRLLAAVRLMRLAAIVGTFYDFHPRKSGVAAAASVVGVSQGSIAELCTTTKRILAARYTSAHTLPPDFVCFFFGNLLLPSARMTSRTASRELE